MRAIQIEEFGGREVVGSVERGAGEIEEGQRVVAMTGTGGYAEYATARAETTFPLPDGVDDGQALALLIQGLTAWHLYKTCGRVTRGESVVVISGAGGVREDHRHRQQPGEAAADDGAGRRRRDRQLAGRSARRPDRRQRRRAGR